MAKSSEPSLNIEFAGVQLKSPIGVGAVGRPNGTNITTEMHTDVLLKHVEAGAGFICIPTCVYTSEETKKKLKDRAVPEKSPNLKPPGNRGMRADTPRGRYGIDGIYFFVSPLWGDLKWGEEHGGGTEKLTEVLMKEKPSDIPIIANIMGYGDLPDSYVDAAKKWEGLGVDLLELNISCPGPPTSGGAVEYAMKKKYPARFLGAIIGEEPDIVENIARAVVKAVKIPVGVKLTPEIGFLRTIILAKRLEAAGVRWIQTLNCAITIAPPDIYNRGKPFWQNLDANPFVSATGSWLRRECYRNVASIAKYAPGLHIAASGGIDNPHQCVEAMMLGARQIQLCTGVMVQGRSLIRQCDKFLKNFLVKEGYKSLDEIVGLNQPYIKNIEEVDTSPGQLVAVHDDSKCTNCGQCADNICIATYMKDGEIIVNEKNCTGCGCCMIACPADAISMVPVTK